MSRPPMLMHLKIKNRNTDFGIWIPLFLIALIALAVVIALLPLIVLAFIIMLMAGLEKYVRLTLFGMWALIVSLWSMRGLEVNVENPREHIIVSVI